MIVLYALLCGIYRRATPLLEASDEAAHVKVAMYVQQHGRLPAVGHGEPIRFPSHEMSQGPLYYVLAALWVWNADFSDAADVLIPRPGSPIGRADIPGDKSMWAPHPEAVERAGGTLSAVHRVRGLSALMGLGVVVVAWRLVRELAPDDSLAAFAAGAWVAFNPMFLFIANSVNNDNLVALLSALVLLALVRMDGARLRPQVAAAVGALIGLAILAKTSGLVLLPVAGLAILTRHDAPWPKRGGAIAALVAATLAVSGWWFVRNKLLYGDWTAFSLMTALLHNARATADPWALLREWDGFLKSYWGVFGGFNVIYTDAVYLTFFALTAAALVVLAAYLFRGDARALRFARLLTLASALNVLAVGYWTSRLLGSQGRLLFPTLAAHAVLWALSTRAFGSARNAVRVAVAVLLFGLALLGGAAVIPAQYPR